MSQVMTILTDEMATIVTAVKTALGLPVLEYRYGYVEELNLMLKEYENEPSKFDKKLPLVWLAEPFDTKKGEVGIHGTCNPDIFIFYKTEVNWKAKDRMEKVYVPYLYPIYNELLKQIVLSTMFDHIDAEQISHTVRKGYYWDEQRKVFNSTVDCLKIYNTALRLHHKQDCVPTNNF